MMINCYNPLEYVTWDQKALISQRNVDKQLEDVAIFRAQFEYKRLNGEFKIYHVKEYSQPPS